MVKVRLPSFRSRVGFYIERLGPSWRQRRQAIDTRADEAVVDDGYGLSYAINDDILTWCITTKNGDAEAFAQQIVKAAEDLRAMMERAKAA